MASVASGEVAARDGVSARPGWKARRPRERRHDDCRRFLPSLNHAAHIHRHLAEMAVPMMLGMTAGATIIASALGIMVKEAIRERPSPFVLVTAFSMTVPIIAWMCFR